MPYISRLNATVEDKPDQFRGVPYRLDTRACIKCLQSLGVMPAGDPVKIAATGVKVDLKRLDAALDQQQVSFSERLRLKHSLSVQNLLERGKSVSWPNSNDIEKPVKWADRFK
jgi:hypothetical protein